MQNPFKAIVILLFVTANLIAQKNIDPTPQDIQSAKSLREKYKKDDVAILESSENISFEINKKDEKVIVKNKINEQLMNINHRADITKYELYNSQSKIETFSLKYRNNKEAAFMTRDELYKDKDLFYNDARVKYINLDFPVQGYTYNYLLEKKYEDIKYFTSLYFNDEYPVLKKTIVVTVPDWLNIELKEFNFEGQTIAKTKSQDAKNGTTTYTYSMDNVLAYSKDEDAPGFSFLYPHILVIGKSFKNKDKEVTLFNSTADLYKWYKSLVDQMKDDPSVFSDKVKQLTTNTKTDVEKVKNIFYWVQDNIRYIAFEDGIAGFKPDESNSVYSKRFGDCKGMANLTKQMLKIAGFDARLTWIGTKHIAYDYTTPSLAVDNHMICTVILKGEKYFLDGTENYNSFGEYAERIQNKEVMIEDGDKFIIDKVPTISASNNKEIYTSNFVIENEKLKGTCKRTANGEARKQFLQIYNSFETDKKGETLEKYLSNHDNNIHVDNIKTSDLKNRDVKLSLDYTIVIDNKVSTFDNEIYIDLENRNEFKDFEFKDRKTDYEFDFKKDYESTITLAIPPSYTVTKLPSNLSVNEENYSISISFQKTPTSITYKKSFIFKNAVIKANEMEKWNASVKKLNEVYNTQITLSKL